MKYEFHLVFEVRAIINGSIPISPIRYTTYITMEHNTMKRSWIEALEIVSKERFMETQEFIDMGMTDCILTLLDWKCLGEPENKDNEG